MWLISGHGAIQSQSQKLHMEKSRCLHVPALILQAKEATVLNPRCHQKVLAIWPIRWTSKHFPGNRHAHTDLRLGPKCCITFGPKRHPIASDEWQAGLLQGACSHSPNMRLRSLMCNSLGPYIFSLVDLTFGYLILGNCAPFPWGFCHRFSSCVHPRVWGTQQAAFQGWQTTVHATVRDSLLPWYMLGSNISCSFQSYPAYL